MADQNEFFDTLDNLICLQIDPKLSANETLKRLGCPSMSVAILEHGQITSKVYSVLGHDTDTVYQACSISKPIGSMAIMRLVQEGKLRLDAPITGYLSDPLLELIATPQTQKLLGQVTLKQLMSHTAGLSQGGYPGYRDNPPNIRTILRGVKPSNTPQVSLNAMPGHRFSYSGGGMTVLQLILEESTGKPFAELVRELVLDPLEMSRSFYELPKEGDNYAECWWHGDSHCDIMYHILPEQMAAGIWTTPTDLLKAANAMQKSLKDGRFLKQELARKMLTEVDSGVALTWFAPKDPGVAFGHGGGNNPTYRCNLHAMADLGGDFKPAWEECGIAIMTNSDPGRILANKLITAIAYYKGWPMIVKEMSTELIIPYATDQNLDERWKEWKGTWDGWKIDDFETGPAVSFKGQPAVRLLATARPEEQDSIALRLEGLELMLMLRDGQEKEVELWDGQMNKKHKLDK